MEGDETVDLMDPKIAQNIVGKSESLCDKPLYVSLSLMMVYCGVKTIASKTGHVTPRILWIQIAFAFIFKPKICYQAIPSSKLTFKMKHLHRAVFFTMRG